VRSHVLLEPPEGGLAQPSVVQCEQVRALSASHLMERPGRVHPAPLAQIEQALRYLLGL
jgi:mRNA interferase MazF